MYFFQLYCFYNIYISIKLNLLLLLLLKIKKSIIIGKKYKIINQQRRYNMPLLDINSKEQIKKYNQFLEKNNAFFTQMIEWGKVKNDWEQYVVYTCDDNNNIVMSANFIAKKLPFFKKIMVYSPRGPVGDVNNKEEVQRLLDELYKIIDKKSIFCVKFDPLIPKSDDLIEKYNKDGFKIRKNAQYNSLFYSKYNMCVNLEQENLEVLRLTFNQSTRRKIKLSEKEEYKFEISNKTSDLKRFFNLYVKTNERKNLSGRKFEYLECMLNSLDPNNIKICVVSDKEGNDLASSILIFYNDRVYYAYGATDVTKNSKNASYFMHWQTIKMSFEQGYKIYDMGVVNNPDVTDGVYLFKEGFCRSSGFFEAIGEIDFITNHFIYNLFVYVLPLLKKARRMFNKLLKLIKLK
ncbi:MAG: peptidoglycan bridge formation glycyltransferase FemA/FemB family protein [Firmicutes bacterium]|nr:peptidoglycan bridge formation glycyltransferase FemA/FemB family protein [Bacillota bacterium]